MDEVHAGIRDRESIVRGGGEAAEDPVGVHVRQGLEYLQILFCGESAFYAAASAYMPGRGEMSAGSLARR